MDTEKIKVPTEEEAREMLARHGAMEPLIVHLNGTADMALKVAQAIKEKNPEISLNPRTVRVAALLHDLGRTKMTFGHEYETVKMLEDEGYPEFARMTWHGTHYEKSVINGKPNKGLLPQSMESKIVTYADSRFGNMPMTISVRIKDVLTRYEGNETVVEAMELAGPRFLEIEKELTALAEKDSF